MTKEDALASVVRDLIKEKNLKITDVSQTVFKFENVLSKIFSSIGKPKGRKLTFTDVDCIAEVIGVSAIDIITLANEKKKPILSLEVTEMEKLASLIEKEQGNGTSLLRKVREQITVCKTMLRRDVTADFLQESAEDSEDNCQDTSGDVAHA